MLQSWFAVVGPEGLKVLLQRIVGCNLPLELVAYFVVPRGSERKPGVACKYIIREGSGLK